MRNELKSKNLEKSTLNQSVLFFYDKIHTFEAADKKKKIKEQNGYNHDITIHHHHISFHTGME